MSDWCPISVSPRVFVIWNASGLQDEHSCSGRILCMTLNCICCRLIKFVDVSWLIKAEVLISRICFVSLRFQFRRKYLINWMCIKINLILFMTMVIIEILVFVLVICLKLKKGCIILKCVNFSMLSCVLPPKTYQLTQRNDNVIITWQWRI